MVNGWMTSSTSGADAEACAFAAEGDSATAVRRRAKRRSIVPV
jgi:hypothetical protein